jgi:hypothetical protein
LGIHEFGTLLAPAGESAAKYLGNRNAQERGGGIGTIIDVLLQCAAFTAWTATISHQAHRINFDQQCDSATFVAGLGIKHMRLSESETERLRSRRILAEQVTQVRGRLMCRRQSQ